MRFEFLHGDCPGRLDAENHIRSIYKIIYGADVQDFAPLLVTARNADNQIMCAAGIRTSQDQFFSDRYLDSDLAIAVRAKSGIDTPKSKIMEITSLASNTPFPVLPMLDAMIEWGRANGMTCGVFTATRPLRRLLKRTGLSYIELAAADISKIAHAEKWGSYYEFDPRVCAFCEVAADPMTLSPRPRTAELRSEAS